MLLLDSLRFHTEIVGENSGRIDIFPSIVLQECRILRRFHFTRDRSILQFLEQRIIHFLQCLLLTCVCMVLANLKVE